jgi:uncharacterized protein (DUF3084 family)
MTDAEPLNQNKMSKAPRRGMPAPAAVRDVARPKLLSKKEQPRLRKPDPAPQPAAPVDKPTPGPLLVLPPYDPIAYRGWGINE